MMDFWLQHQDLEIANGDFALCPTDKEAIAQAIVVRLKTLAGEWFLDENIGIPYFTEIFGRKYSARLIKELIATEIQSIAGISEVKDFTVKIGTERKAYIGFSASLSDGTHIPINESIGL
jgi:hypothetical protein